MTQPESRLSRRILDALRKRGIWCFKVHGSEYMMSGLPDLIACKDGQFYGLEVKMPEGRLSAIQKHRHIEMRKAGAKVFVVRSVAEALEAVREE